jgi:hypothetical protein
MKPSVFVRTAVLAVVVATLGCQENRQLSPTAASLLTVDVSRQLEGVWGGPMTLIGTSGGECTGAVVGSFLPATDRGTVSITQEESVLQATMTMESTGLACRYTGTATAASLALNATSCDRTGLIVQCEGDLGTRELRLVGSSISAVWDDTRVTGMVSSTYNVFTTTTPQTGVGSLVANHDFTATPR